MYRVSLSLPYILTAFFGSLSALVVASMLFGELPPSIFLLVLFVATAGLGWGAFLVGEPFISRRMLTGALEHSGSAAGIAVATSISRNAAALNAMSPQTAGYREALARSEDVVQGARRAVVVLTKSGVEFRTGGRGQRVLFSLREGQYELGSLSGHGCINIRSTSRVVVGFPAYVQPHFWFARASYEELRRRLATPLLGGPRPPTDA